MILNLGWLRKGLLQLPVKIVQHFRADTRFNDLADPEALLVRYLVLLFAVQEAGLLRFIYQAVYLLHELYPAGILLEEKLCMLLDLPAFADQLTGGGFARFK